MIDVSLITASTVNLVKMQDSKILDFVRVLEIIKQKCAIAQIDPNK